MNELTEDPPATTQGVPRVRSGTSASTYGRNYWETGSQVGGLTLREWLNRAFLRADNPLSRQPLILFLEASADKFRNVDADSAESLGVLMGRLQDGGPIEALLRSAPQAEWWGAFIVGIAKTWTKGLTVVATTIERKNFADAKTFVPALARCLRGSSDATRAAAGLALTVLAARGDADAFRAVELRCLAKDVAPAERKELVRALIEAGTLAIVKATSGAKLQQSVDVAVGIVDVAAKTGELPRLDIALSHMDPAVLPIEVSVAILASSRHFSDRLAARAEFGKRFGVALHTRRHPEADKLFRYAK